MTLREDGPGKPEVLRSPVLRVITGNKGKIKEIEEILGADKVEQLEVDLKEIQGVDAEKIMRAKLLEALNQTSGELLVDDTSLYFDCTPGLPGPLIKWFLETQGTNGLAGMAAKLGNTKARATTMFGYAKSATDMHFFSGTLEGTIVSPRGGEGFGWDAIFQPDGSDKTLAEMSPDEKNAISPRKMALERLKEFLVKRDD